MKTYLRKSFFFALLLLATAQLHAFTAVVSGNWSSPATWGGIGPGTTVTNQDVTIPAGITVTLDSSVSFNGLLNSLTVNGTLTNSNTKGLTMMQGALAGSGTINIHHLIFSGIFSTVSFTGTLTAHNLQNMGASVTFTAPVSVIDSLMLDSGSISLGTGANLSMMINSVVRRAAGTLASTGGVFTTGFSYDVWYVGRTKTTGLELTSTTLRDLHVMMIDNTQKVSLNQAVTVNGILSLSTGILSLAQHHLTIIGNLSTGAGAMFEAVGVNCDLSILGSGPLSGGLAFTLNSAVNNFVLDRPGGDALLTNQMNIASHLDLVNGNFWVDNGGTLVMNFNTIIDVTNGQLLSNGGTFDGTQDHSVFYLGTSHTAGLELKGSGLHGLWLMFSSSNFVLTLAYDVTVNVRTHILTGQLDLNSYKLTCMHYFMQNPTALIMTDSMSSVEFMLDTAGVSQEANVYFDNNAHLDSLIINDSAVTVTLNTALMVNNLALLNGMLKLKQSDLTVHNGGTVSGYSDSSYVVTSDTGMLVQYIASNSLYKPYPLGTMSGYAPIFLQQNSSGGSGWFGAAVMDSVFSQPNGGFNMSSTMGVVNKTWTVQSMSASTNVNMNVRVGWTASDEVNGFNRNSSYITHYNNPWDNYTAGAATTGPNNTYEQTRNGVTSGGWFAVVDNSVPLAVPVLPVADFNVYPNPSSSMLNVEVVNPSNAVIRYELLDVTGKMVMSTESSNAMNRMDLSSFDNGVYYLRITNAADHSTVTKRVVKD